MPHEEDFFRGAEGAEGKETYAKLSVTPVVKRDT